MNRTIYWTAVLAAAVYAAAAPAATLPSTALHELRSAEHQIAEAELLRNVANDRTEAQHLLAARDLLAEAEPSLHGALRQRAQRLEFDIDRDAGAAAADISSPLPDALGPVSVLPTLDRADLGALSQRSLALVQQAQNVG